MQQKYQIQQLRGFQSKPKQYGSKVQNESIDSSGHNQQVLEEITMDNGAFQKQYRKYGNIKILYQNDKFLFTIGPDYICFFLAFLFFTIMHFVVIYTAAVTIQSIYVNIANVLISMVQSLSYLFVALSNPGIQTINTLPTNQNLHEQVKRFCKKCGIKMQKGTHHCRDCDVCIRNYDHHCPWTSKCIGQKNLIKFYFFVTSTMIYLVYFLIMLLVCMATNSLEHQANSKTKSQ